jgi:DNA primase catalytic subunit
MCRYELPEGMRYSTLEERKRFYTQEFDPKKVCEWFGKRIDRVKFAAIIGRHTRIFPEEYRKDFETTIIIDEYTDLNDMRDQVVEFLPESVYYDRTVYDEKDHRIGQELAFDLDPENVECPIHGGLAEKMEKGQGLSFCRTEFGIVREQAISLYENLENDFKQLGIVYSGRGFHIHVFDQEAYGLGMKERLKIARLTKKRGFAIDEWVTAGEMRLIRLPFSLHGLVSRIAVPLAKNELSNFNPISDDRCVPSFLKP